MCFSGIEAEVELLVQVMIARLSIKVEPVTRTKESMNSSKFRTETNLYSQWGAIQFKPACSGHYTGTHSCLSQHKGCFSPSKDAWKTGV